MPTQLINPEKLNWLSGEQKRQWLKDKIRFLVMTVVGPQESTYHDKTQMRYVYTCRQILDDKTGELGDAVLIGMTQNMYRDQVASTIAQALAEDPTGVGPCILEQVYSASAPSGFIWSLAPAE